MGVMREIVGDAKSAHQIVNKDEVELRYLALSIKPSPKIAEFPAKANIA